MFSVQRKYKASEAERSVGNHAINEKATSRMPNTPIFPHRFTTICQLNNNPLLAATLFSLSIAERWQHSNELVYDV